MSNSQLSQQVYWFGMMLFGIGFWLFPFGADLIWFYFTKSHLFGNGDYAMGMYWTYGIGGGLMLLGIAMMVGVKGIHQWMKENWPVLLMIIASIICLAYVFPVYFGQYWPGKPWFNL